MAGKFEDRMCWRDKPLRECSREELLEAIESAWRRINQLKDERDGLDRMYLQLARQSLRAS